ncbi:hypothetical protein [Streptomyces sp. NBC_01565]|uniref:hypothetical protein n=1 Tax=Streptomyces sp. NBC_01565 TaxID=2975881 RepID=UPI0022521274|nr:hypothetical protein [Streptomyces sp. NBC_01565]MCX4543803.1 hypothetical protein [Streptomyces sp. NBC_01565]
MTASAQSGHSIVDQPATVADCQSDLQAAQARREDEKGLRYADQLGTLGSGLQNTHRS